MQLLKNNMDTIFQQIALKMIKEQEFIIGPLAWEEAKRVKGLKIIDAVNQDLVFEEEPKQVLDRLVAQYERLFGRTSREICRAAVLSLTASLPKESIPATLQ